MAPVGRRQVLLMGHTDDARFDESGLSRVLEGSGAFRSLPVAICNDSILSNRLERESPGLATVGNWA